MKHDSRNLLLLLWKRLPYIAIYTLAFYILFFVIQRGIYHFAPSTFFLDYYSVNVSATPRHYEGEPIPFRVCRHKRGNYPVQGYRIIYKLTDNVHRQHAKMVANYPINGQITQNECSDVTVNPSSYYFKAGSYYFKTVLNFHVNGEDKQVSFESNTFTVEKKVLTPQELQTKIDQLEKEIEQLKAQLSLALAERGTASVFQGGAVSTLASKGTTTMTNNTTQTATTKTENSTNTLPTTQSPSRQADPVRVLGMPICVPDPLGIIDGGICVTR